MAAILHTLDQRRLIDSNGIADGASIYFYTTGTLTPAPVYTTSALSVEHSSPIVVASGAAVPDVYLDSTVTYRRRIVYSDGSVDDTDPYNSGAAIASELASTDAGKGVAMVADAYVAVRPEDDGAAGDGATDDTAAITAAIARLTGNRKVLLLTKTYLISSVLTFSGLSNFKIVGGGTIKIADGTATGEAYSALAFVNCSDFLVEGITVDGNRAGRTPAENSGHLVRISGGSRGAFRRVRVINGTTDGWYIRASDVTTESTYPTDMLFDHCDGYNCYRNNMSIIGSKRLTVRGGRYHGATGTAPQAGIGIEPNSNDTYGNEDLRILDFPDCSDNAGFGCYMGSNHLTAPNTAIIEVQGSGNTQGVLQLSRCWDVKATVKCGAHSSTPSEGLVDISSDCRNPSIDAEFDDITCTNSGSNYCVAVSTAVNATIRRLVVRTSTLPALRYAGSDATISNVEVNDCSSAVGAIQVTSNSANVQLNDIVIRRPTGIGLYLEAPRLTLNNYYVEDCASTVASVRIFETATDAVLRNGRIHQTSGSVPDGAVGIRLDVAPKVLGGLVCTGGYTATNIITQTASFVSGTKAFGFSPDPFSGTATIDPASIAAQATTTATSASTFANTNDRVLVTPLVDLQGLQVTGYVSATGTITYRITNPTAGAIDLASGSWTFTLLKF